MNVSHGSCSGRMVHWERETLYKAVVSVGATLLRSDQEIEI